MKKYYSHLFALLVLLSITLYVYPSWFVNSGILTDGDWYTFDGEILKDFMKFPNIWSSSAHMGGVALSLSMYPILILSGLIGTLGGDFAMIERILFMWPIIAFSIIGMYIFGYSVLRSKIGACVASIVYFFNSYSILSRTGHLTISAAFSMYPIVFFMYERYLKYPTWVRALVTSVGLFFVGVYEIRIFYVLAWLLIGYIFCVHEVSFRLSKDNVKNQIVKFIPLGLACLFNLYWILPVSQVTAFTQGTFFQRILFGNAYMSLESAINLFHPFWSGAELKTFIVQDIPVFFWLIPLFAFTGLYVGRQNIKILYFGFVAIIGILLSKQVDVPFPNLYEWLFHHFPGFVAFRESSKFYGVLAFAYAMLIGSSATYIYRQAQHSQSWLKKASALCALLIIPSIFLVNALPLMRGDITELLIPHQRPQEYALLNNQLAQDPEFSRTLWVPIWSRWSFYTELHPRVNFQQLIAEEWLHVWKQHYPKTPLNYKTVFNQEYSDRFLDLMSIKYIIVPMKEKRDDFYVNYDPRYKYVSMLSQVPYLRRTSRDTSDLLVLQNEGFRPHIYSTHEPDTIANKADLRKLFYKQISPTIYQITLPDVTRKTYVYFTETFHPDWKLKKGSFTWSEYIFGPKFQIPDSQHLMTDTQSQVFEIEPMDANNDDPKDIVLTLYFKPQKYVYVGSFIVVGMILIAGVVIFRKHFLKV